MPEPFPEKNALVYCGTTVQSGTPNTGQVLTTLGGTQNFTKMSGVVGPDNVVWVGGGRLDAAFFHDSVMQSLSGLAVVFYDSAVAVSGGPLAASGHKVVGVLSPAGLQAQTAVSGGALRGGVVQQFGFPFFSGLVASTKSGQAGFSANYTPVVSG